MSINKLVLNQSDLGDWCISTDIKKTASFPEYSTISSRLASFEFWPHRYFLPLETIAKAGFFSTFGDNDHVTCFSCSGGLKNFEPFVDIDEMHAFFFPRCKFINFKKGHTYVKELMKKKISNSKSDVCSICLENPKCIFFYPCGHVSCCRTCSTKLANCPMCRVTISEKYACYIV